jgi:intracellular septation protein A
LIRNIHVATSVALAVVCVELGVIAWIRHKFMDSPWTTATLQVVLGGLLVFLVGMLIGSS